MTTEQKVTLKELKELEAKATSAPWGITSDGIMNELCVYSGKLENREKMEEYFRWVCTTHNKKEDTELIVATRNALPELIRVIELAEEALDYALSQMQPFCSDEKVKQALSEIRKMKGE